MGCCNSSALLSEDLQISSTLLDKAGTTISALEQKGTELKKVSAEIEGSVQAVNVQQVEVFLKENVQDQVLVIGAGVEGFVRENIQETLDAIKDLKLKQRVSDIIYPIFRRFFVHSIHGTVEDSYKILDIIGQGSFSTVRKALHLSSKIDRAIKIIAKNSITDTQKLTISEETEILKSLDHPNVIKIVEVIEDTTKLNIVTEICNGGELFEMIVSCKTFSENTAAKYMYQILSGLIHIHERGIIHRDIKPENILFVDVNQPYLKIIDFGIAIKSANAIIESRRKGTAYYMAPEVIQGEYDSKCDIWSCGIILYIMLCGHPPFNGKTEEEILGKINRGVFNFSGKEWLGVSKDAKNLVQRMLTKNRKVRPTAQEAWNDPWIQDRFNDQFEDIPIESSTLEALASFRTSSRLQRATLSYIAYNLTTAQEINELKNAFVALDSNGDGHLSASELKAGYANLKLSTAIDIGKILETCDTDLNGMIDYNEFITATIDWKKNLTSEVLETVFKAYDQDKSGTISIDEIKGFFGDEFMNIENEWERLIAKIDTNGDGVIDLQEFKNMMLNAFY